MKPEITDAITALHPTNSFVLRDNNYDQIEWVITPESPSTKKQVDDKLASMISDWDALAWSRNRAVEYPAVTELTVSLFDTDDKAALETKRAAVKTKWPKDNSGPVE